LSSDPLKADEREEVNQSKILVQEISIKALRVFLTFRMKGLELSFGSLGLI